MDDLQRFIDAQDGVHTQAEAELARGRKVGHWMWFVFPQLRGLGTSPTAQRFGIADRAEADAYLAHPLLGARLRRMVGRVLAYRDRSAEAIFGPVDALKLRSCLTLFRAAAAADADRRLFDAALAAFYAGEACPLTAERLASHGRSGEPAR